MASTETAGEKPTSIKEEENVDLFDSDEEENEESRKAKEERLRAYRERKSQKPKTTAKTAVTLDVKPWGELGAI
jgi:elongation factor 1-beta